MQAMRAAPMPPSPSLREAMHVKAVKPAGPAQEGFVGLAKAQAESLALIAQLNEVLGFVLSLPIEGNAKGQGRPGMASELLEAIQVRHEQQAEINERLRSLISRVAI